MKLQDGGMLILLPINTYINIKKDSFEIFEVHEETMLYYCDGLCSILGYVLSHTCMCYSIYLY